MIVARGFGQSTVLGAIAAFGYGIGGVADVTVEPEKEKFYPFQRRVRFRRPPRQDDDEVLLMVQALFTTEVFE